jgi:O-antigen/teichoic acid export membrane protein
VASLPETSRFGGVASHLRVPLFRNAYALMTTTVVTAVLGVAYWTLAARHYAPADIGRASAAISMMIFLGGAAQLNLNYAMPRLLPSAGEATRRYVVWAYVATVAAGLGLSAAFVLILGGGSFLAEDGRVSPGVAAWYVVAVAAWAVFALQDGVLAGLGQAIWVPIENAVFALAKVALLVVLATAFPRWGLFASWTVPMVLTLVPVTWLVLRRFVPRNGREQRSDGPPAVTRLRSYLAAEYAVGMLQLGAFALVPVIVAASAGLTANGYFYTAWIVGLALDLAIVNIATSLTVEGARDTSRLPAHVRSALRMITAIVIPASVAAVVLAPLALRVLGGDYADRGAAVLQLVAAGVVFRVVSLLYIAICRVRRRMRELLAMEAAHFVLIIGLTLVLVPAYGIAGAGAAYLATQAVLAVVLLWPVLAEMRADRR